MFGLSTELITEGKLSLFATLGSKSLLELVIFTLACIPYFQKDSIDSPENITWFVMGN